MEEEVAEGRKREDIRGESTRKAIGPKAEGGQGVESPQGVGGDRTVKPQGRKPKLKDTSGVDGAGDASPRPAN